MASHRSRLLALNDPRLSHYLAADDERVRSRELERILTEEVRPHARSVLSRYIRSDWPIEPFDADDILGHVTYRVLRKLRSATVLEEESVQNLEAYVTTLTKNAVRDLMRQRSPQRTRVKSRLRYLVTRHPRLALWPLNGATLCGFAAWANRTDYETNAETVRGAVRATGGFTTALSELIETVLDTVQKPVRLEDLVAALAPPVTTETVSSDESAGPLQHDALEARQYLQVLWGEIRELLPKQRAALLLNLREPGSGNAVALFVSAGLATLDEIAEAIGMSRSDLSAIWDTLPLDDLKIGEHLGLRRQQVINLRKAARERLTRRMAHHAGSAQ